MFRFVRSTVVVTIAVWMLAAPGANAAVGFQPVVPDELKMTSEPQAPERRPLFCFGRLIGTTTIPPPTRIIISGSRF